MRGWLSFPLGRGFRLGISPSRSWLSFPIFGGIVSATLNRDLDGTRRVLERTQLFTLAESLGGVESLIEHPAIMTHATIPPAQRQALGITDGFIRLSVGVEDADDLIADLAQAMAG